MINRLIPTSHRWPRFLCAWIALVGLAIVGPADAAEDLVHVGHTTSVVKDVQGQAPGQDATRIVEAEKIYFNENVVTSGDSSIIIQFRDGSTFEMGPDGAMTLDDMVFNPFESETDKVVNLLQGTFRYISGYDTAESGMTINTPIGSIGIRGSNAAGAATAETMIFTIPVGTAVVSNENESETIAAGQSTAVSGAGSDIISGNNMPDSMAAEVMNFIDQTLSDSSQAASQSLSPAQQADNAAVNMLPIDQQALALAGPAVQAIDVADLATFALPDLIQQAASSGVLNAGAVNNPTPDQQATLSAVETNNPNAAETVQSFTQAGEQANAASVDAGTQDVVAGTSANVADVAQIAELMQATVAANPGVTAIAASAAISGGSQNEAAGDIADVAQQVGEGVVAGASDAGVDIAEAVQAAGEGVVAGATESNLDVGAVTQGATQGAITGAVDVGADVGAVANAASQGAVQGAVDAGADVGEVTAAATAGAISAAVETGVDVADIVQSVSAGAITAAVESGADVALVSQSVTTSAIETSESLGQDVGDITSAIVAGATDAADTTGTDLGSIIDPISETVGDTVEPATDVAPPADEPAAPEQESEQQNNASQT